MRSGRISYSCVTFLLAQLKIFLLTSLVPLIKDQIKPFLMMHSASQKPASLLGRAFLSGQSSLLSLYFVSCYFSIPRFFLFFSAGIFIWLHIPFPWDSGFSRWESSSLPSSVLIYAELSMVSQKLCKYLCANEGAGEQNGRPGTRSAGYEIKKAGLILRKDRNKGKREIFTLYVHDRLERKKIWFFLFCQMDFIGSTAGRAEPGVLHRQ